MAEPHFQNTENPRRRILTSVTRQQLETKTLELVIQGWERVGDIGMAKSVVDSEPPYFTQAMVQIRARLAEGS